MSSRLGVVVGALIAALAGAAPAVAGEVPASFGLLPERERSLLVTFADRPDAVVAGRRLTGLGTVHASAPAVGVWELRASAPGTVRSAALRRRGVRRAEWSLKRTTHALTDPRPPRPVTLPLQVLPAPTDPLAVNPSQQWPLHTGTWSIGMSAHPRPTIAILDSGIDSTHEEWRADGLLVSPRSTQRNTNTAEDHSPAGHGTHVAGIAAAPANGVGIVGVAPASASGSGTSVNRVIPVQITNVLEESSDATLIRGIVWAVDHGARVINISSGGRGYSHAFQETINWAYREGVLIVASVGNEGQEENYLNYPAAYAHVIGVGAQCDGVVDPGFGCPRAFRRATFSNFNESVDLLAPGVAVLSTLPLPVTEGRVAPGYGLKDGTSMAAPYVAGVAALVFASHPGISPHQVTRILATTASRGRAGLPRTSTDGWGIVNARAAVTAPAPVDDLAEMNDDVRWLARRLDLRPTRSPVRLTAWADANDDPIDVYPVILRRGERLKVTIVSSAGRLVPLVFRPSVRSFERITQAGFDRNLLGRAVRPTPRIRTVVVRARESGRHFVVVAAEHRGGAYSLRLQRL
jgi:hypothetical protein